MIRAGWNAAREMVVIAKQWPDIRVLVVSGVLGTFGAGLSNTIVPLYLNTHGLDLERIGIVYTIGSLVPMFLQPILGAWSDQFDRRKFVIATSLVTSFFLPILALLKQPLPLAIAISTKLMLERGTAPVSSALIGDRAPKEQRATIFGLLAGVTNVVFVGGLILSSAAVAALTVRGVFFIAGLCFFLASCTLWFLQKERSRERQTTKSVREIASKTWQALISPFRYARTTPTTRPLLAYQFLFTFALDLYPIYLPLLAIELGAPEASVGPLVAASWLVYAFVLPAGGRWSDQLNDRRRMVKWGLYAMSACGCFLGVVRYAPSAVRLPLLITVWVVMAIPDGIFRPSSDALVLDQAPPDERGRFLGAIGASQSLANVLAPIFYGVLAKHGNLGIAFIASAAAFFLAGYCASHVHRGCECIPAPTQALSEAT